MKIRVFSRISQLLLLLFLAERGLGQQALDSTKGVSMIQRQSSTTTKGNFELVLSSSYGGMQHWTRKNENDSLTWDGPVYFGSGFISGVSMIESSYTSKNKRSLDLVAVEGGNLVHYWNDNGSQKNNWHGPTLITTGVTGVPCLIQSNYGNGSDKNFEVVVPLKAGGMIHFYRDNGMSPVTWFKGNSFGTSLKVEAVSFIQNSGYSNIPGSKDNFELVAKVGGQLIHFWRSASSSQGFTWNQGETIPGINTASGFPSLIQTAADSNFQLATPTSNGNSIILMRRNNSTKSFTWSKITNITPGNPVSGVCIIFSSYQNIELEAQNKPGNLSTGNSNSINAYYMSLQGTSFSSAGTYCYEQIQTDWKKKGLWTIPYNTGVVGISSALLSNNNLLFIDYGPDAADHAGRSAVLNYSTGKTTKLVNTSHDLFCSGLSFMKDGTLLTVGGHGDHSAKEVFTFTPSFTSDTGQWTEAGKMTLGRWYPTCTTLPSGDSVFAISGTTSVGNTFKFDGCTKNTELDTTYQIISKMASAITIGNNTGASAILEKFRSKSCNSNYCSYSLYPFSYVLPDGRLFLFGNRSSVLLKKNNGTWKVDGEPYTTLSPYPRTYPVGGSSVLLPLNATPSNAKIMVVGGAGAAVCPEKSLSGTTMATKTCEVFDMATKTWIRKDSMNNARVMPDAILLPDTTVLVVNGSTKGYADDMTYPVFTAELYNISNDTFTSMNNMRVPRLYHSTALLLPDGRVLTAGKDPKFNKSPYEYEELRGEVFYPPYLFKSDNTLRSNSDRPIIAGGPTTKLAYGSSATLTVTPIKNTGTPTSGWYAVLIAPGAVTHGFNMQQRLIKLPCTASVSGNNITLSLTTPANANIAPAGKYMLFVLQNENGKLVPSKAVWTSIGN